MTKAATSGCLLLCMAGACCATEVVLRGHAIWSSGEDRQDRYPMAIGDGIELRYKLGEIDQRYYLESKAAGVYKSEIGAISHRFRIKVLDFTGRTFGNPHGHFEFRMEASPKRCPTEGPCFPQTLRARITDMPTNSTGGVDQFTFDLMDGMIILKDQYDADGNLFRAESDSGFIFQYLDQPADWFTGLRLIDIPTTMSWSPVQVYLRKWQIDEMHIIHDTLMPGDANVDGVFDQLDVVHVLAAGRYLNGDRVAWSQGDWNGDGVFDRADLILALQDGGYGQGPRAALAAVPEPTSMVLTLLALLGLGSRHARLRQPKVTAKIPIPNSRTVDGSGM